MGTQGAREERTVRDAIACIDSLKTDDGLTAVHEHLVKRMEGEGRIARLAKTSNTIATPGNATVQVAMIKAAGGIVVIPAGVKVPPIPEKYSMEFLQSKHPLREGSIASHVILGFDPESGQWICIDRGSGGTSDPVPGSLGKWDRGLSGEEQDRIIADVEVEGVKLISPDDYEPVKRIIDAAIAQHEREGKPEESRPFWGHFGRTADTKNARIDCRVLLGLSSESGTVVEEYIRGDRGDTYIGLLAAWN